MDWQNLFIPFIVGVGSKITGQKENVLLYGYVICLDLLVNLRFTLVFGTEDALAIKVYFFSVRRLAFFAPGQT